MRRLSLMAVLVMCLFLWSCSEDLGNEYDSLPIAVTKIEDTKEEIQVYITGEVKRSGVYHLEKGSRVESLVEAAGGFTTDANRESVNLAAYLNDGEKIHIPKVGEELPSSSSQENKSLVELTSASKDELMRLPGVGEKTAEKILEYRKDHAFEKAEDLLNVPGIGEKTLESFKGLITVGGKRFDGN